MNLENRIRQAMEHAPTPGPLGLQTLYVFENGAVLSGMADWTGLDDYDLIHLNPNHQPALNAVEVDTAQEYYDVLVGAAQYCRLPSTARQIGRIVTHERRHAGMWEALGVSDYKYGVAFTRRTANPLKPWHLTPYVIAPDRQTTKLEYAATCLPPGASQGDRHVLKMSLGYTASQLRDKVEVHNAAGRLPFLPVSPRPAFVRGFRGILRLTFK